MSVRVMSMVYAAHFHDITFIHKGKKKETGEQYEKNIRVLNSNLKSVCLALADHANDEGEGTYPSIDTITNKTELSEVTVIACLKAMKQEGIIWYVGRSKWHTCNYTINRAKIAEMSTWTRQKREKPETKAALVLKVKPLQFETKAALPKPSIHPKPSSNEEDETKQKVSVLKTLYEENVGAVTPLLMGLLRNAAITYPEAWYQPAFEAMVKSAKHRSWSFVEAVLDGWKKNGFGWKPTQAKGDNHAKRKPNPPTGGKPSAEQDADSRRIAAQIRAERAARQQASV